MSDKTKIISSKEVLKARLFSVSEDNIEYPTGKKVIHHNINKKPTVSIFPITEDYEIYLISEYRYLLGKTVLSAAAGFMDRPGEKPLETAKREAKEELGITATQWEQIASVTLGSSVIKSIAYLFLAKDISVGEQHLEEDEQIEVIKMSLDDAVRKVMNGEITATVSMTGILMLDRLRKEKKL